MRSASRSTSTPPPSPAPRQFATGSTRSGSRRLGLGHEIADAADRVDRYRGAALGEMLAQPMHIDLDGVGGHLAEAEDVVLGDFLRQHPALAPHEQLEDRDLAPRHG